MNRFAILVAVLALFAVGGAFSQSDTLAVTDLKPQIDGVVKPGEYSFSKDYGQLTLYLTRTSDALSVAVVGKTTGWVAFGLGSGFMEGATIFMGFVQKDGTVQFKPQAGRGHGHGDTAKDVTDSIVSYAMKETGEATTLEVQLKPSLYLKPGQASLAVIYADGADDAFLPRHMFRGSMKLSLVK